MRRITTNVSARRAGKLIRPLRRDPTRTTNIQRQFLREIVTRFNDLNRAIYKLIVTEDAFGLSNSNPFNTNTRFAFDTDPGKVAAFRQWLTDQVNLGVLQVDPGTEAKPWTSKYVRSTYQSAAVRAFIAARPEYQKQSSVYAGTKAEFLREVFDSPVTMDRIELLATRSFENLRGITSQMSSELNTIFADGLAHGKNPKVIAKEISDSIDKISRSRATRLARTEVINTYAEGTLDSYERLGVDEVGIQAEWSTAGDDRVCPQCAAYEGQIMSTKDARGLIPLHPNCRCAWLPYLGESITPRGKRKIAQRKARRKAPAQQVASEVQAVSSDPTFGHSATSVVRWMGKEDWTFKEARDVLKARGVNLADATIKIQLRAGQKGQRGAVAAITSEERSVLEALRLGKKPDPAPDPKPIPGKRKVPKPKPDPIPDPKPDPPPPRKVKLTFKEPPTAIIRWMGKEGWNFKQIRYALDDLGLDVADGTVRTQMSMGRRGKGKIPAFTDDQIAKLNEYRKTGKLDPPPPKPTTDPVRPNPPKPKPPEPAKGQRPQKDLVDLDEAWDRVEISMSKKTGNSEADFWIGQEWRNFQKDHVARLNRDSRDVSDIREAFLSNARVPTEPSDLRAAIIEAYEEEYNKSLGSELMKVRRATARVNMKFNFRQDDLLKIIDPDTPEDEVARILKDVKVTRFLSSDIAKDREALKKALNPNGAKIKNVTTSPSDSRLSVDMMKRSEEAEQFLNSIIPDDSPIDVRIRLQTNSTGRAFARKSDSSINMDKYNDVNVYVHEIGHNIEFGSTRLTRNAQTFRNVQAAGQDPILFAKRFGGGYRNDEYALGEIAGVGNSAGSGAYVAKVYVGGATEVLAMGFEALYVNPVRLAKDNPAYFDFMINTILGNYH